MYAGVQVHQNKLSFKYFYTCLFIGAIDIQLCHWWAVKHEQYGLVKTNVKRLTITFAFFEVLTPL